MTTKIPLPVRKIMQALNGAGFEAYIVGGCVRDLFLGRSPKDWDITTNARPDQITKLFPESFYENDFGTVGVKVERFSQATVEEPQKTIGADEEKNEKEIIEVTTYRTEAGYEDKRRPSKVSFSQSLEEDLSRRDFTINAMAYGPSLSSSPAKERIEEGSKDKNLPSIPSLAGGEVEWHLVDPFKGEKDLKEAVIRTVGLPEERFGEDALRLMRAIRLYAELRDPKEKDANRNWRVDEATYQAIQKLSPNIKAISWERIGDEFQKIILSRSPSEGVDMLQKTGLLRYIIPELEEGVGVTQNLHHVYTVWEHNLRALETCPSKKLSVRLATLLHDVGKPRTKKGDGYRSTFYNHDHVGARMTKAILSRLRYPKAIVEKAVMLVDNHLFYYNVGEVTEASVRRLIKRVGLENMEDLMAVRIGDRLGSGVPKAKPYKLRHLEYMIEKVSHDPLSVKMLAINGNTLMQELGIPAGPKIGAILDVLLASVLEDPAKNTREELVKEAARLKDKDLKEIRALAKEKIEEEKEAEDKKIKKRHWVE